jgi:hypothetical protein
LWDDPWLFGEMTLALASALAVKEWRRVLPSLLVGLLALRSVRFAAEWALLSAPLCALGLSAMSKKLPLGDRRLAGAMALVAVIVLERRVQPLELGLAEDVVPFSAIDFVTREGLRDRLYVNLDVGCYLLWEGWPRYSVFQDARLPAYPDDFHRALDHAGARELDVLLRKFSVDAALINDPDVDMRAGDFDPEEWALVWRTPDALVFARRTPEHRELIARREIPLRPRFAFEGGTHLEPLWSPPPRSPVDHCQWLRRLERALRDEARPDRAVEARLAAFASGCLDENETAELRAFVYGLKVRVGK